MEWCDIVDQSTEFLQWYALFPCLIMIEGIFIEPIAKKMSFLWVRFLNLLIDGNDGSIIQNGFQRLFILHGIKTILIDSSILKNLPMFLIERNLTRDILNIHIRKIIQIQFIA